MFETNIGKIFIIIGIIFIVIGILLRFPILNLGKLPGDILVKKENFTFYFPIVTSIVISVVLSIIFFIISQFINRK